jgi:Predicted membrane protein
VPRVSPDGRLRCGSNSSPALGYWTPGLGRSVTADWDIAGGHLAERCGLFVILALGESILINGATFAELTWDTTTLAAFASCLIGSIAMWWIYFNIGAERASHLIEHARDPGAIARYAYTYLHIVIVAGLIVSAAGDEIVLPHPHGETSLPAALVLTGGPMLFLMGCLLFKWATAGWPPFSHMGGIVLLALLFAFGRSFSPLVMTTAAALILCVVALWETVSLGPKHRA